MLSALALLALASPIQVGPISNGPVANGPVSNDLPELQLVHTDSLAAVERSRSGPERFWWSEPDEWTFATGVADTGLGRPVPGAGPCLQVESARTYSGRVRGPHSLALVRGVRLEGPFTLEVEAMQTGRETPHRDLVLVFGFRSPEHYYYAHIGTVPDEHSCNVFEVQGTDRRRLGTISARGFDWGRGVWRKLRLECDGHGHARVFAGDDPEPLFEQVLDRPATGLVGFGTFDDAGAFRNLKIHARPPLIGSWHRIPGRMQSSGPSWKSSPFGSVLEVSLEARDDPLGTLRWNPLHSRNDRSKERFEYFRLGPDEWLMCVDADGDGEVGSSGDRWIPGSHGLQRLPTDAMLPLDQEAVLADHRSLRLSLDSNGAWTQPYACRFGAPAVSRSEFLKAQYSRVSGEHPPAGGWSWSTPYPRPRTPRLPLLIACTPSTQAESWRWDQEVFSDPRVLTRLKQGFDLWRIDSSSQSFGGAMIPVVFLGEGLLTQDGPCLVLLGSDGQVLGSTHGLPTPEAFLKWLDEPQRTVARHGEPFPTRRAFHYPWQKR